MSPEGLESARAETVHLSCVAANKIDVLKKTLKANRWGDLRNAAADVVAALDNLSAVDAEAQKIQEHLKGDQA